MKALKVFNFSWMVMVCGLMIVGISLKVVKACPSGGCEPCNNSVSGVQLSPNSNCNNSSSSKPVRYLDGVLKYTSPGLFFEGVGTGFGVSFGFNNNPTGGTDRDFNYGVNWWMEGVPFLESDGNSLYLVRGARASAKFVSSGGNTYNGQDGVTVNIVLDSGNLVLKGIFGGKIYFYPFTDTYTYRRGKAWKITTPGGEDITFTYNSNGLVGVVDGSAFRTWEFVYSQSNPPLLTTINMTPTGMPNYVIAWINLDYYGTGEAYGLTRDLKHVIVNQDGTTKTAYYRYYTDQNSARRVKYILDPESYVKAKKNGTTPETMTDALIQSSYADYYYVYYTSGDSARYVSTEYARAIGCDCTGGRDLGQFLYDYTINATPSSRYNDWKVKVTQTNPDESVDYVTVNSIGSAIDVVKEKTDSNNNKFYSGMHYVYDATTSQVTEIDSPSACTVNPSTKAVSVGTSGLIEKRYYDSNWGPVNSYKIKDGSVGTEVEVRALTYPDPVNNPDIPYPLVMSETKPINEEGQPTRTATVSYSYTFYTDDSDPDNNDQVQLKTTSFPSVPALENGPSDGSYGKTIECYHPTFGKVVWRSEFLANNRRKITAYKYNSAGQLEKKVEDPDLATWNQITPGGTTPAPDFNTAIPPEVLITEWTYDDASGRVLSELGPARADGSRRNSIYYYTYLSSGEQVVLSCAHINSSSQTYGAPIVIKVLNAQNQIVTEAKGISSSNNGYLETVIDVEQTDSNGNGDVLDDAFGGTLYERVSYVYAGSDVVEKHIWEDAENGVSGTHYKTYFVHDKGELIKQTDPDGTITNFTKTYDTEGAIVTTSIGATGQEVIVEKKFYHAVSNSLGNELLVKVESKTSADTDQQTDPTRYYYDWKDRLVAVQNPGDGTGHIVANYSYDMANRRVSEIVYYEANSSSNHIYDEATDRLISKKVSKYDVAGRVYQIDDYQGDLIDAMTSNRKIMTTKYWYDYAGNLIKSESPTGMYTKIRYDNLVRETSEYISYDATQVSEDYLTILTGDPVIDDVVLSQTQFMYDKLGNIIEESKLSRYHDATSTGGLSNATVFDTQKSYDILSRLTSVDLRGTDSYTTGLVTSYQYNSLGKLDQTVDPAGKITKYFYDNLGRTTKEIKNFIDGSVGISEHDSDQITEFGYGAANDSVEHHDPFRVIKKTAYDTTGTAVKTQQTRYVYGVPVGTTAGQSKIASGKLLYKIAYADPTTGIAHYTPGTPNLAADLPYQETMAYDRQGRLIYKKGQALSSAASTDATVHEYTYDFSGKMTVDKVTTLRSDVYGYSANPLIDGPTDAPEVIKVAYDMFGRPASIKTNNLRLNDIEETLNEIAYTYNSYGQVTISTQENNGVVTPSSKKVGYGYSECVNDSISRLTSMTYPDDWVGSGKTLYFEYTNKAYPTEPDPTDEWKLAGKYLVRMDGIALDNNGIKDSAYIAKYEYMGTNFVTGRNQPKSNITVRCDSDAVSPYSGLDRYWRINNLYEKINTTTANQLTYSYNTSGTVASKYEQVSGLKDEIYIYDNLNRLIVHVLDSYPPESQWTVSNEGNFTYVYHRGSSSETRTHNAANEIATVSANKTPAYDKSGNMTEVRFETSGTTSIYNKVIYDAWNRPFKVQYKNGATIVDIVKYYRDGLGRVVQLYVKTTSASPSIRDLYYSENWQVLVERESGTRKMDYIWGLQYIDEIICRRDYSGGGNPVRHHFLQDANWNVISLVNSSNSVVERYRYDPYGKVYFLNNDGTTKTTNILNTSYLFQGLRRVMWQYTPVSTTYSTETYHVRNREYLASFGRFLQRDPIGIWGDGINFGNGYAYVGGDPVNGRDPSGLADGLREDPPGSLNEFPVNKTPPPGLERAAIGVGVDIRVRSSKHPFINYIGECCVTITIVDINAYAYWSPNQSWVAPGAQGNNQLYLHELYHLKLAQLFAAEWNDENVAKLKGSGVSCCSKVSTKDAGEKCTMAFAEFISSFREQLKKEWKDAEQIYDDDTKHGTDYPKQKMKMKTIDDALNGLLK